MVNSRKIKGRLTELGLSQADVAKALKITQPTASLKINGQRPLYLAEAEKLAELLRLESGEFGAFFFSG